MSLKGHLCGLLFKNGIFFFTSREFYFQESLQQMHARAEHHLENGKKYHSEMTENKTLTTIWPGRAQKSQWEEK